MNMNRICKDTAELAGFFLRGNNDIIKKQEFMSQINTLEEENKR
jgi:hypothetical protein